MAEPTFSFFLIHKDGYQAMGAWKKQDASYVMFRLYHPNAQVYDPAGRRKAYECVGGIGGDDIQHMVESGEWDIAGAHPFQEDARLENAYQEDALVCA